MRYNRCSNRSMVRPRPLLTLLAAALALPAAAGAAPVTLSPAPGTPDAAAQTQISVLGPAPGRIRAITLRGSQTGVHPGRWARYSGGRGASFLPARPFAAGERVTAVLRVARMRDRRWSFTIARAGTTPPVLNLKVRQEDKLQHFVTQPDLVPPQISVLKPGAARSGSIFLTPLPSPVVHPGSDNTVTIAPVGPGGPMIIDGRGRLVWFSQLTSPDVAANLRVQRFAGRRVLTWWQGPVTAAAFGLGSAVIADTSYRTLHTVHAGNGYAMDIHEFTLTPDGDALFTVYSPVLVHAPGTPAGAQTSMLDAIVQEVDVRTGLVVWEWHAYGHIPLSESLATPANSASYDAFHINSIQALPGGRALVSARDTSAIYLIRKAGGKIVWRLGGKHSDFRLGPGARFWFQHDALLLGHDRVSLFDDEAGPPQKAPSSRGLILRLDTGRHRATVVRALHRSEDTSAQSEGSLQTLPGGNLFLGFGAQPFFTQLTPRGKVLFDARLPIDDGSYRAYRFPWSATPRTRPVAAARRAQGGTVDVYASWNGATAVARWQVLAGPGAGSLRPVATTTRSGFETRVRVTDASALFAVRALDARGRTLGTSPAVGPS